MKKIYLSLGIIAIVAIGAVGATRSFFSDTETSTGNTFTAGAIDLKIDSEATYNGIPVQAATWELKDLVPTSDKFFNFSDIKPGDEGENTISLHVLNNDAYVCAAVSNLTDFENGQTEPESSVDLTTGTNQGELSQTMLWKIWNDNGLVDGNGDPIKGAVAGDNIYQVGEKVLKEGNPKNGVLSVYDSTTETGPLLATETGYLGVAWSLPAESGNETQTDSMTGDISFNVVQSRNNAEFVCGQIEVPEEPTVHRLVLENETEVQGGPWTIIQDNIYGNLTWTDGPTFDYDLSAQGLTPNTSYSLIYYADPWPGNNPGAFIGSHTTDSAGAIIGASGNPDLGMDLPAIGDANYSSGAKIWLVRTSDYNSGNLSTGPMTTWNPSQYLFEGNVYSHYNDTNN